MLSPSAYASISDSPIDGSGDAFNADPGALERMTAGLAPADTISSSVILEYDISSLAALDISTAVLDLALEPVVLTDPQIRAFDIFLYSANGIAELADLSAPATYLDTIAYSASAPAAFSIDLTAQLQASIDAAEQFLGLRVEPIGSRNPASIVSVAPVLTYDSVASSVPEPATVLILGIGAMLLMGGRKN
jgi:hypothetical protein